VKPPLTGRRIALGWAAALAVVAACIAAASLVGSTGFGVNSAAIHQLRLERALLAAAAGAALATAGVGYQAVLRNPLAEPYLLGVSGGAALAAFAWTLPALALPSFVEAAGQNLFAFLGGLAAVAVVLALAGGRGRLEPQRAVLVGVVLAVFSGGVFALLAEVVRQPAGGGLAFLFGRIPQPTPLQIITLVVVTVAAAVWLTADARATSAVALSEDEAAAVGISIDRARWSILIVASLAAATATAVVGPIGFIGLMGPHLARLLVGGDVRRVLPAAFAVGAALLCLADAVGRSAAGWIGTDIAAGVLTNLAGAPFFLLLLYRRRGEVAA
jgi:iron complex transport system permease protein